MLPQHKSAAIPLGSGRRAYDDTFIQEVATMYKYFRDSKDRLEYCGKQNPAQLVSQLLWDRRGFQLSE